MAEKQIGKYRVDYDKATRVYSVVAPDGVVISTHPTLADAVLAAERYIEGDKRHARNRMRR